MTTGRDGPTNAVQLRNELAAIEVRLAEVQRKVRDLIAEMEVLARRRIDIEVLLATSNGGKPDPGGNAA